MTRLQDVLKSRGKLFVVFLVFLSIVVFAVFAMSLTRPEKIAFESFRDGNFEIYVMDTDGRNQARLTNNPAEDKDAKISNDGNWIVFTSTRDGNYEIYRMKSNGTQLIRITNSPSFEVNPALSYDNSAIAFVKGDADGPNIYVMNFEGSHLVQLTDDPHKDLYPSWASDGSEITFCSDRDGNCEIYLMDAADGSYEVNLTNRLSFEGSPSYSPTMEYIAFNSNMADNSENLEIYIMKPDGTNPIRLTNHPATDSNPHWSRDGKMIFFQSDRDGDFEIYRINVDGTGLLQLTSNEADDFLSP